MRPTRGLCRLLGADSQKDIAGVIGRVGSIIETPVFFRGMSGRKNPIPLELLKADQDRISKQETAAKSELEHTKADLERWQYVLSLAIKLAGDCHAANLKANPKVGAASTTLSSKPSTSRMGRSRVLNSPTCSRPFSRGRVRIRPYRWSGPDAIRTSRSRWTASSISCEMQQEMAPVTKSVELPNQVRLPYVEQGDPSGVPVLLVHAIADSWHAFEPVLPHLPDSIRAFALTQRGHGDASHPAAGYHAHDFAADLMAFMDALHLEAAVIAGGSSGGFIARRFAIDHPERTLGLVLIGSPFSLRDKPGVQEIWDSTLSKLTDPVDPAFVRDFVESTFVRPVPRGFIETLVQESLKVPARVWKATMEGLLEDESYGELNKIKAPTLIVWGDQDAIIPRTDQETLAAAIADSRLVVYPGAGHTFYWEEPERIASDLAAFIDHLGR